MIANTRLATNYRQLAVSITADRRCTQEGNTFGHSRRIDASAYLFIIRANSRHSREKLVCGLGCSKFLFSHPIRVHSWATNCNPNMRNRSLVYSQWRCRESRGQKGRRSGFPAGRSQGGLRGLDAGSALAVRPSSRGQGDGETLGLGVCRA